MMEMMRNTKAGSAKNTPAAVAMRASPMADDVCRRRIRGFRFHQEWIKGQDAGFGESSDHEKIRRKGREDFSLHERRNPRLHPRKHWVVAKDLTGIGEMLAFQQENGPTGLCRYRLPTSQSDFATEGHFTMFLGDLPVITDIRRSLGGGVLYNLQPLMGFPQIHQNLA